MEQEEFPQIKIPDQKPLWYFSGIVLVIVRHISGIMTLYVTKFSVVDNMGYMKSQ